MLLSVFQEGSGKLHGKDVKGLIRVHEFLSWSRSFCAKPTIKNRSNGMNG